MSKQIERRLDRSLFSLFADHGAAYADSLLGRKREVTTRVSTAAIGPDIVMYNPEFVDTLNRRGLDYLMVHEGLHITFMHPIRKARLWKRLAPADRNDWLWNYAADVEINGFVDSVGSFGPMPEGGVPGEVGITAEEVYMRELGKMTPPPPPPPPPPGGDGEGDGSGDDQGNDQGDGDDQGDGESQGEGQDEGQDEGQGGGQGGGDPMKRPEGLEDLPGQPLDHIEEPKREDGSSLSDKELDEAALEEQIRIEQSIHTHIKEKGSLPAGMAERFKHLFEVKRDWREHLTHLVSSSYDQSDYSYRRPKQRGDILLTTLRHPAPPRIAFCGDTSGSVSDDELKEVFGEVLSILQMYNDSGQAAPLDLILFDSVAYHHEINDINELDDVMSQLHRGGTCFRKAFEKVAELDEQPEAIIFATDGYDYDFGPDPGIPVLWVMTKNSDRNFEPPFGEVTIKHD